MTRRTLSMMMIAAALALASGCDEDKDAPRPPDHAVMEALEEADLELAELKAVPPEPYAATSCQAGTVKKLAVLICAYADAATAQSARGKASHFIGEAVTGAVRQREQVLIVVADRDKIDPTGKVINAVLQAAAPPPAPTPAS